MPNYYDFSKLENVKETLVYPDGWINPIIVEYGTGYHSESLSYFWRVKGTKHTFIIPILRIDYISGGDYASHFKETLEVFRDDYKGWASEGWYSQWMKEYFNEFNKFIII